MKRNILQLLVALMLVFPASLFAQDSESWNDLVITEYRNAAGLYNSNTWAYLEFTNMGKDTLDLSKYWGVTAWGDIGTNIGFGSQKATLARYPGHKLNPGETFTWAVAQDNGSIDIYGDSIYPNGYINYEAQMKADFVAYVNTLTNGEIFGRHNVFGLFCRADTNLVPDGVADSAMVDKFWYNGSEKPGSSSLYPIAGILTNNPLYDFTYVRKFKYKKGNTDFTTSRGTNLVDSEWQPLPRNIGPNDVLFTTFDTHMVQENLDITPKKDGITVDVNNGIINVPYDIPRDSVFRFFKYGPNHAWKFKLGTDTAKYFISNGDSVEFYVVGNELKTFEFAFNVTEKPANYLKVAPLVYKNTNGNYTRRYSVSDGYTPMDSVGRIPFNCPVDTLIGYLVIDESASYEFIWKSGIESCEVSDGDILRISANGQSKDYRLAVYPYNPSDNSSLSTVIFSGMQIWENPFTFEMTDTMLPFRSDSYSYIVNLPEGTETSPAVIVTPSNINAKYYISRAKNLNGSEQERTITINVTAEDDSTTTTYSFLLNVDRETPDVIGEPFFCDVTGSWGGNAGVSLQVFNPLSDYINIGDYMIMQIPASENDFEAFLNKISVNGDAKQLNKATMRPGSYIQDDTEGNGYFALDFNVGVELEGNGVFSIGNDKSWPATQGSDPAKAKDKMDMVIGRTHLYEQGFSRTKAYWQARFNNELPYSDANSEDVKAGWLLMNQVFFTKMDKGATYALFKILEDSVKDGEKPVFKNFFDDFELVDVVNGISTTGTPWTVYANVHGQDSAIHFNASGVHHRSGLYRKPGVYTGNPTDLGSFGTPDKVGEWEWYGVELTDAGEYKLLQKNNAKGDLGGQQFGRSRLDKHVMLTTAHLPYLTSKVYLISTGISNDETIYGVLSGTDVNGFMENIIKPDPAMQVVIKSSGGVVKEGTDPMANGDMVTSTSVTEATSVTYNIVLGPLSSNTTLTAKDGAEFKIEGTAVSDIPYGMTIKDMFAKIEAPLTAKVVLTDGEEYVIPHVVYKNDTMELGAVDALVSEDYVIEVTAQDGVSQAKYSLAFAEESGLFVKSDVYKVNEDLKQIDFVSRINVETFLSNLIPSPGAQIHVENKLSQIREIGIIQYHDKLIVSKGGERVLYYIKFMDEEMDEVAVEKVNTITTGVYPNPCNGTFEVSGLKNATSVKVRNITGQLVKTVTVTGEAMNITLDAQTGIYFVSVMNNNKVIETHKVILK